MRPAAHPRRNRPASTSRAALLGVCLVAGCLTPGVSADELDRVTQLLALEPGSTVADIGAGDGDWSVRLARIVGSSGRVLATEVTQDNVSDIEKRVEKADLDNVDVVLGSQSDLGLPAGCCDAILVRMVYHHFQEPAAMRAGLESALRSGGLVLVVDTEPQRSWGDVDGELDRGGHGIPIDELIAEMTSSGFEVVERRDQWKGPTGDPYAVLFRWPGRAGVVSGG